MNTRKLVGLAGSMAVCLATGRLLSAAGEPPAALRAASPAVIPAVSQVPGAPAAPAGAPPVPGALGAAPAAPAAAPPMTLWTFLGFPTCDKVEEKCKKLKELLGIPPAPPPLGGAAAANSPNAAVKAASGAKAEVDAKPAKIKAIRYLANLENACCYPGVKDALLAGLNDCDWEVRREAAAAFGKACCCEPDVLKRLKEITTKRDAHGRFEERIDDVRCAAERSLNLCMCRCGALPEVQPEAPEAPEAPQEAAKAASATRRAKDAEPHTALLLVSPDMEDEVVALVNNEGDATHSASMDARSNRYEDEESIPNIVSVKPSIFVPPFKGSVVFVDKSAGVAELDVLDGEQPPLGARAQLYHRYPIRTVHVGEVEVVGTKEGKLLVRPGHAMSLQQIKKGDKVVGGQ